MPREVELAAFVTSQYLPSAAGSNRSEPSRTPDLRIRQHGQCAPFVCGLVQWTRQVHRLASRLQELSGERTSVHLFSPCMPQSMSTVMAEGAGSKIVIHPKHRRRLIASIWALQQHARRHPSQEWAKSWASNGVQMLCRWEMLALTQSRLVVYLDLDVEVMPSYSLRLFPAAPQSESIEETWRRTEDDWLQLLRCANASNHSLLSYPDHSSPVNGALLIARPSLQMYEEGLGALERAALAPWNSSTGWDGIGRPSRAVPITDHVWYRKARHTRLVDRDDWAFVGGQKDQGLLFYIFRVRHAVGADIRLTQCADASRPQTSYYHYGSVGGTKPEATLQQWLFLRSKRRCYAKLVPHFAHDGTVLRRTLGWAWRTRAEIQSMQEWLDKATDRGSPDQVLRCHGFTCRSNAPKGKKGTSKRVYDRVLLHSATSALQTCSAAIDDGFQCVAESSRKHESQSIELPDAACYSRYRCTHRRRSAMQVLREVRDDVGIFARPSPLLSPAQTSGYNAPYVSVSRFPGLGRRR